MRRTDVLNPSHMGSDIKSFAARAETGLFSGLSRLRGSLGSFLRSMQHARMVSVLSSYSDARLAVIGITRDEISDYAAELVGHTRTDR